MNRHDRRLVDGSRLFARDDDGVRDLVVPLIALQYGFQHGGRSAAAATPRGDGRTSAGRG